MNLTNFFYILGRVKIFFKKSEKKACQKRTQSVELFFDGGCSSVGRAPGCGLGGRGFKPHHSPHKFCPVFLQGFFCI